MPYEPFSADKSFEALLEYLQRTRGFDFAAYKRPSLVRRVDKRMQMINLKNYGDYIDYLEVHPEEFIHLFNMILINVTAFFRDQPAWDSLAETIIPKISTPRSQMNLSGSGAQAVPPVKRPIQLAS